MLFPELDLSVMQFLRGLVSLLSLPPLPGLLHMLLVLTPYIKVNMLLAHIFEGFALIVLHLKLLITPKTSLLSTRGRLQESLALEMPVWMLSSLEDIVALDSRNNSF